MFCSGKYDSFRWLQFFVAIIGTMFLIPESIQAQFAPPAGQPGSTAISADSAVFVQWASSCTVERGYMDISDTTLGFASYGADTAAAGEANNSVISLGDGGSAVLFFEIPLTDGPGFDFAVFENSFSDDFLELAFVEVSSDGSSFFRFQSISNTQTDEQVETFGTLDARQIHNLAGKYRSGFGTPFDLSELGGMEGLDIQHIIAVKIIDVVGSIDTAYATYDSEGNIINDPWPTPFESSGFDLDAVGVIHDLNHTAVEENPVLSTVFVFPNPARESISVQGLEPGARVVVYDPLGQILSVYPSVRMHELQISLGDFPKGCLLLRITGGNSSKTLRIIHL